jgi:subfamily B ATP-binding cassette protein MsbA
VVLEGGRITAIGSHEELLISSPTYQRLYQLQFIDTPEAPETQATDPMAQYLPFDGRAALAARTQE